MKKTKRISAVLTALTMSFCVFFGALDVKAAGYTGAKEETDALVQELVQANPYGHQPQYGDEWWVLNLARSGGLAAEQREAYYRSLKEEVETLGTNKLEETEPKTNARVVITLNALNYDATDVAGYNLVAPLQDKNWLDANNGSIDANVLAYAILALNSGDYKIDLNGYVTALCGMQKEDMGFGTGWGTDVDTTCAVIQALAPYYTTDPSVKVVVDNALSYVLSKQQSDAGFGGWGYSASDSTAIVIMAAASLGINPATDSRFVVGEANVVQALHSFYSGDGKFLYDLTGGSYSGENDMSSYHAMQGFIAYDRLLNGKTSFYDMSDVRQPQIVPTQEIASEPSPEQTPVAKSPKTGERIPVAVIAVLLLTLGSAACIKQRSEKK